VEDTKRGRKGPGTVAGITSLMKSGQGTGPPWGGGKEQLLGLFIAKTHHQQPRGYSWEERPTREEGPIYATGREVKRKQSCAGRNR